MFEEWVSTEMMVRKVIDDDKAAANTFFKETALPLARNLETWIPTEIDNAPAFDYEGRVPQAAITFYSPGMPISDVPLKSSFALCACECCASLGISKTFPPLISRAPV